MRSFCEFSEYNYGYAVTEDFVRRLSPGLPPEFPTLREEAVLGYDVWIAGFIFLQFKRPKVMSRRSSLEHIRYRLPLVVPFYRMPLYTQESPSQHDRLLVLEQTVAPESCVVSYACPAFHQRAQLNSMYQAGEIVRSSLLLPPSRIGGLAPGPHHVSYNETNVAWALSEPKPVTPISLDEIIGGVESAAVKERFRNPTRIGELRTKIMKAAAEADGRSWIPVPEGSKAPSSIGDSVNQLRSTARRLFDVEVVPVLRK